MKEIETVLLEVRVYDDGALRARRKDRRPLTDDDRAEARKVADSLPGITVDDVLRVFPAARVRQCPICELDLESCAALQRALLKDD